ILWLIGFIMLSISPRSLLSVATSALLLTAAAQAADVAQANPEMGDLERWTAFSLGGGDRFSWGFGHAFIDGDVGLARNGNFLMGGDAVVNGDVYDRSDGNVLLIDHAFITGTIFDNQDALLDN